MAGALFFAQPDDAESKKLVEKVCGQCHKIEMVTNRRLTRDGWQKTIQSMVDKGAEGTEEEFNAILDYLAKHYAPDTENKKQKPESGSR